MGFQRTWTTQVKVISPALEQWKKRFDAVVVIKTEDDNLEARVVSYSLRNTSEIDTENIVSLLTVNSYREASRISRIYNKMTNKGIRVLSLNNLVEAVTILGDKHD